MISKPIIKYFKDISIFSVPFSIIIGCFAGFLWAMLVFASFGFLVGLLGFHFFKKNEYYTYYNLGYTKANLAKKAWIINLTIAIIFFLIYTIVR